MTPDKKQLVEDAKQEAREAAEAVLGAEGFEIDVMKTDLDDNVKLRHLLLSAEKAAELALNKTLDEGGWHAEHSKNLERRWFEVIIKPKPKAKS